MATSEDRLKDGSGCFFQGRNLQSKEAGRKLGISPRTVEFHRARIIEKVDAKNTADLIRIVMSRDSSPDSPNGAAAPST
jgi:hypothetical protein